MLYSHLACNSIINMYGNQGMVSDAFKWFNRMLRPESRCQPDVVTWNTVINILGASGKLDDAFATFNRMITVGMQPTHVTYSAMIKNLGDSNQMDDYALLFLCCNWNYDVYNCWKCVIYLPLFDFELI